MQRYSRNQGTKHITSSSMAETTRHTAYFASVMVLPVTGGIFLCPILEYFAC